MAVMVWVPAESSAGVNAAAPLVSATVPSCVEPSLKITVPGAVAGVIVAVKVTDWPKFDGDALAARARVVTALMVSVNVPEVAGATTKSPLYDAVMECGPTLRLDTANAAAPPDSARAPKR